MKTYLFRACAVMMAAALPFVPALQATQANANAFAVEFAKAMFGRGYQFDGLSQGFLEDGKLVKYSMHCYAGHEYVAIASGDEDTRNIDLGVFDDAGNVIVVDSAKKPWSYGKYTTDVAVVTFTPQYTGTYYAVIEMVDSRDKGSYYRFVTGVK